MRNSNVVAPLALIVALCAACDRGETKEPVMTPASRTVSAAERAADRIAFVTCNHEFNCGRVGPGADYATRNNCQSAVLGFTSQRLRVCSSGPDPDDLQECLKAVAEEDCSLPQARLGRFEQCHTDELCQPLAG
ncbi:MAG TPA: DUF6184 family natural product biosynthesis lipoprotein, partial [Polyangiaceae bacterium]|nr:DUF6184 family natural product biosynthesis lipoprotein [Polyangiaceae bacterium]